MDFSWHVPLGVDEDEVILLEYYVHDKIIRTLTIPLIKILEKKKVHRIMAHQYQSGWPKKGFNFIR